MILLILLILLIHTVECSYSTELRYYCTARLRSKTGRASETYNVHVCQQQGCGCSPGIFQSSQPHARLLTPPPSVGAYESTTVESTVAPTGAFGEQPVRIGNSPLAALWPAAHYIHLHAKRLLVISVSQMIHDTARQPIPPSHD